MVANSMIDSGSVCSIITKTANRIVKSTPYALWILTKQDKDLKTFSNEPIKKQQTSSIMIGLVRTVVEDAQLWRMHSCGGCTAKFFVLAQCK